MCARQRSIVGGTREAFAVPPLGANVQMRSPVVEITLLFPTDVSAGRFHDLECAYFSAARSQ